jgi:hypothetical protein
MLTLLSLYSGTKVDCRVRELGKNSRLSIRRQGE